MCQLRCLKNRFWHQLCHTPASLQNADKSFAFKQTFPWERSNWWALKDLCFHSPIISIVWLEKSKNNSWTWKKKWPITHLYVLACYRCWRFKHPSTAISRRTYPVSSAPGSQATSSPVSTWMGDRLGIRDAVGIEFCVFFFLKISVNFVNGNDDRDHYSHTTIFCSLGRRVIRCIS